MAVDFIQPAPAGPFGPGFAIHLNSDFIGPLPTGSFWLVWIATAGDPEDPYQTSLAGTSTNEKLWVWGRDHLEGDPLLAAIAGIAHGETVSMTASLQSPTAILDTGTQTVTWDMISGVPSILQAQLAAQSATQLELGDQVQAIDTAVHMSFPGLNNLPIGEFLGIPLAGGAERLLITPDRTGEGTLDRPVGLVDVAAIGIEWEVVSSPAGNGVQQGAPDRWARRILDLQLVGTDASSNEFTRAYESFNVDHYRYMFQGFGLTRLHYWIEPGVTIRFYWLVFGL